MFAACLGIDPGARERLFDAGAIEPLAGHLVKRAHSEPHWRSKHGAAMAYERVTLYGVPIVAQRKVNYGRIDPEASRELFIRNALVEGDGYLRERGFSILREVASIGFRNRYYEAQGLDPIRPEEREPA